MKLPEKRISNPLTIIALFAMLAETSGTVVLPFLNSNLQNIYIWFLIGFPILLVLLFFGTLWIKYHVLYSPDDYESDENFLRMAGVEITRFSDKDYHQKLLENYLENKESEDKSTNDFVAEHTQLGYGESIQADYMISEELMQRKLKKRYGNEFKSQLLLEGNNFRYRADGIFENKDEIRIFEIKFFDSTIKPLNGVRKNYKAFQVFKNNITKKISKRISFNAVIVTIVNTEGKNILISRIKSNFHNDDFNFELQDYKSLKQEFTIG